MLKNTLRKKQIFKNIYNLPVAINLLQHTFQFVPMKRPTDKYLHASFSKRLPIDNNDINQLVE